MKEQVPALKGIKVAYGQGALLEYVRLLPDVSVFTGNADLFGLVPFGVAGMINPPTSFVPELCVELFNALDQQRLPGAVEAQKRVDTAARIVARALAQVWPGAAARSLSHARLRGETLSQVGNRADAERRDRETGAGVEGSRHSRAVSSFEILADPQPF